MNLRDEFLDFIGGEQKRPLLGLFYLVCGLAGIVYLIASGWGFPGLSR